MPAGLECYDAQGRLMFSATDRLARVLGVVNTNAADGSLIDVGLATGEAYFAFFPAAMTGGWYWPTVTVSGTTLSWSYAGASSRVAGFILYGIY